MKKIFKENINTKEYWDDVYSKEDKTGIKRIYTDLWEEVAKHIPNKPFSLIDIGCGCGHLLHYLSINRPKLNLYGTDFSAEAIKLANKNCPEAELKLCCDNSFPFAKESFDIIICSEVLEHIENPRGFLKRVCTLLKNGGFLITTTPWKWGESDPEHIWNYEKPQDIIMLSSGKLKMLESTIANNNRTMVVLAEKSEVDFSSRKNKLVAMIVVYNEAGRFLARVLDHLSIWVDEIVILDDGSTDSTVDICRHYPKVYLYKNGSRFFNQHEAALRSRLWDLTVRHNPDWILAIDADELFTDHILDEIEYYLEQKDYDAIAFRLFDFWSSEEFYRIDGAWNPWTRYPGIFLSRYQPEWGATWPDSVIHSGRWPLEYRSIYNVYFSDIRIKHFGWARTEDHLRKYLFYREKDLQQCGKIQQHTESVMYTKEKVKLERWFERKRKPL